MNRHLTPDRPADPSAQSTALETIVWPRARDLGGFEVRRVLPSIERRSVGPFVFLDQMGPVAMAEGRGLDVRPHPHIGLATVTYLFEGEIVHRDSLGTVQTIRPGDINWMTAGRGIAHSERTPPALRRAGARLFGIQSWVALPAGEEECEPGFVHHGRDTLPVITGDGTRLTLIIGALGGVRSPVESRSPTLYADIVLSRGASLAVTAEHEERAIYLVEGAIDLGGASFAAGQLLVLRPEAAIDVRALADSRAMLLGGARLDGPRHIWWNFVSSSPERIERAKADWKAGRFAPVPGDPEIIPLPES